MSSAGEQNEAIASAAAVTAVGALATGLAHEVNNPLAVVRTNVEEAVRVASELLPRVPEAARNDLTELQAMLEEMQTASQRIESIVRDLRLFACAEERRSRVDINAVIEGCSSIAFAEIRHRARLEKAFGVVSPVLGNEVKLAQVFFNLLVNAAQAMPEGEVDRNEIHVATREENGLAIIEVADTGSGIGDPEQAFAPFFTTRKGRPGMGLTMSRATVHAHRGTITIHENGERGTIVRVTLPIEG